MLRVYSQPMLDQYCCPQGVIQSSLFHRPTLIRVWFAHAPPAAMCEAPMDHQLQAPVLLARASFRAVDQHTEATAAAT